MGVYNKAKRLAAFTIAAFVLLAFDFNSLPDGYQPGSPNVPSAAYGSAFGETGNNYQNILDRMELKIHGLAKMSKEDEIRQSEAVYYLEHLLIGIQLQLAREKTDQFTQFEREALFFRSVRLYQQLRFHGERLFEHMIRYIDVALPGKTGVQDRKDNPADLDSEYAANFRSDKPMTDDERKEAYDKKLKEFLDGGGKFSELAVLTKEWAQSKSGVIQVEYAERKKGEIWITEGKAGHVLLAEGKRVLSAGQILIVKSETGETVMVVVSNASGNYKPDLLSAQLVAERISEILNVPMDSILLTEGEPLSQQTMKVIWKGRGTNPDDVKEELKAIEAKGKQLLQAGISGMNSPGPVNCGGILKAAAQ